MKEDSLIPKKLEELNASRKKEKKSHPLLLSVISWIFIAASFLSLPGAIIVIAFIDSITHSTNLWVFFLFLPIPLSSVFFGLYLKEKKRDASKNIIIGIVIAVFLCLFGLLSIVRMGSYNTDEKYIRNAEIYTGIDFPAHTRIETRDYMKTSYASENSNTLQTHYFSTVWFDETSAALLEAELTDESKWQTGIPEEYAPVFHSILYHNTHKNTFYLLYNIDSEEFNTLPAKNGEYPFLCMVYDPDLNILKFTDYVIEYVK